MKVKNLVILSIWILLFSFTMEGQNESTHQKIEPITFVKRMGNEGVSRGVTVEEIPEGGYILTGYTTDGEYGGEDVFLIRTDERGDPIWRRIYGGAGNDNGWAVRQTADKGFIVAGFTDSFGEGGMDVYLVKTDSVGNTLWTKTFGSKGDEFGWDIRITEDNGFIIAAQTDGFGNGAIDAYLIKTDSMGTEEWSNTYGDKKTDRIFSVQQTPDGGFIAGGITYSFDSVDPDDRDGYLIKTDPHGGQEWYKIFGKDGYDVVHCVGLTADDGIILTGYGESYSSSGNDKDLYLIKTDLNGDIQWLDAYGGMDEERGIKGEQTKDGGYITIGFNNASRSVYLLKTDADGERIWTRNFGGNNKLEFGYTVKEASDGGFILIGHSENLETRKVQILLIKTDRDGLVH